MRVAKKYVLSLIMRGLRWRADNDLRFTLKFLFMVSANLKDGFSFMRYTFRIRKA